MKCTIEAKILPLVGVSGHLYLEIFDEKGDRLCQINGLATDSKTGKTKSMGLHPEDLIKAYISDDCGIVLAASARCARDSHHHQGCVLFEGSREDVMKALDAMRVRAAELNAENAPYKLLSLNSNTIFSEMVKAAAGVIDIDGKALSKLTSSRPLPGVSTDFNKAVAAHREKPAGKKPRPPKPPSA